jgi:O-antigen/teichoic acid export membrane protein
MLVVLARLGSPEMVGRFTLGLAITAPVFMFTSLQLRSIGAKDARGEFRFGDYLGLQLAMSVLGILAVTLTSAAVGYRSETLLVVATVGLAKAIENVSEVFYGLIQRNERMGWIARAVALKAPLALFAMAVALVAGGTVFWFSLAMAAAWIVVLLAYEAGFVVRLLREEADARGEPPVGALRLLRPRWQAPSLKALAAMAFPLGLVLMLSSLNTNVPRYFVERHFGERELGIFAAMAYVTLGLHTIARSLAISGAASLARHYVDGETREFRRLVALLAGGGLLIGVAGVLAAELAGPAILRLLYGAEYAVEPRVFVWLMAGAGISFVGYALQQALTAARCLKEQAYLFGAVAAATTIACFLLVPWLGLMGAAYASILSAAVQAVGALLVLMRALRGLKPELVAEAA